MTDHDILVRYIVDAAVAFYAGSLGFDVVRRPAPAFALPARGALRPAPGGPGGGGQPMPDGRRPEPGGWKRFSLPFGDLESEVERLRAAGVRFRNDIVTGVGGKQVLLDGPAGNPVELFERAR